MGSSERAVMQAALDGLAPFVAAYVEQVIKASDGWGKLGDESRTRLAAGDLSTALKVMKDNWKAAFEARLPRRARSYLFELADTRNDWAHHHPFTSEETERALDTIRRFSNAIGAPSPMSAQAAAGATKSKRNGMIGSGHLPSQRDVMRAIYVKCGRDDEQAVREYAAAERRGEVHRSSNRYELSAEKYARALLADGKRKSWL